MIFAIDCYIMISYMLIMYVHVCRLHTCMSAIQWNLSIKDTLGP